MKEAVYDIIIVGAGPAGLTAAIYTSREMLNVLLLEKGLCGGLPLSIEIIENYPGFPDGINGPELVNRFKQQAERFGTAIMEGEEVKGIKKETKIIKVQTDKREYQAKVVIVASGSVPKKLNVPGEEKFSGRGVSYCATCDGPLFKNKDVAVIGCGNSGLQEGESLLKYVKSVAFIAFSPEMKAAKILQERLQKNKQAKFLLNHALIAINGQKTVDSLTLKNRQTKEEKVIKVSGVFIYAGFLPNSKFLAGSVKLDKSEYILTDEKMQTSAAGIYAVGDIRAKAKEVRQIDTSCAEGTIAALAARDYLKELKS